MIRSMTGYGRRESTRGAWTLTVEMKAVNHRFCDILVRLPKTLGMLEDRVRKMVSQYIRRGRVDVFVNLERTDSAATGFSIDWNAASQYVLAAKEMNDRFSLQVPLTAKDLLQLPGVLQEQATDEQTAEEWSEWLMPVVAETAEDLLAMRAAEGAQLLADLRQRLAAVQAWTEQIRQLAPTVVEEYRVRLTQRIAEWTESSSLELDQQRLAQEVAYFADRCDISEEATRLVSHCSQFIEQLHKEEAVGRKLDFLLQEMNREANTIASKANSLPIQRLAVEIKTELEKMREQVQNIE